MAKFFYLTIISLEVIVDGQYDKEKVLASNLLYVLLNLIYIVSTFLENGVLASATV